MREWTALFSMLLKKYFKKPLSIFNWHLTFSYNRATDTLYSNFILFQSTLLDAVGILQVHKTTQLAPNLLIQSCYNCSILKWHSNLYDSFANLTRRGSVKGGLEVHKTAKILFSLDVFFCQKKTTFPLVRKEVFP
mgnify:CR=1 FL=1